MDSRKPQRDRIRGVIKTKKVDGNSGQPSWRFAASASTLSPRPPAARRPLREVGEEAAHSPLGRRNGKSRGRGAFLGSQAAARHLGAFWVSVAEGAFFAPLSAAAAACVRACVRASACDRASPRVTFRCSCNGLSLSGGG